MPWDPQRDGPYWQWLQSKNVNTGRHGRTRTSQVVDEGTIAEGKPYAGQRYQVRRDELGSKVRERSSSMAVSTGQDVKVAAPTVAMSAPAREVRDGVA